MALRGRALLEALYDAAVAGAAPGPLTAAALSDFPAPPTARVWLYALGKAAHTMASAAVATLDRSLHTIAGGVVVSPESATSPHVALSALPGDHPVPGPRSFAAAQRIAQSAAARRGDDLSLVLVSGGASSLAAAPLRGSSETDLVRLYELLLGSGLDVRAMNTVRKRFARWGAGRLAVALAPARTHALVFSDVIGDEPADVGSGPCSPDPATALEVTTLLERAALLHRIPTAMREHLAATARGAVPETPKPSHPAFAHVTTRVIGSNRLAVDAAVRRARSLSLRVESVVAPLRGDAARCGTAIAESLLERAALGEPVCIVWGGETTVRLDGGDSSVRGGRCQELALSAARRLAEAGDAGRGITLLAAGTDGRDGPTDAAGAVVDAAVWTRLEPAERGAKALARHDAYGALDGVGALVRRGLTGTNVMDVVIGVVEPLPFRP